MSEIATTRPVIAGMKICLKDRYSRSMKKRRIKRNEKDRIDRSNAPNEAVCIDPVTVEMDAKSRRMRV